MDTRIPKKRLAIFASGQGSNAVALMNAVASGYVPASLVLVFSNNPQAPVLEHARARGYLTACIPHKGMPRSAHEEQVLQLLHTHSVEHVLLAGYMRVLSPFFLTQFKGKVLNIHPSLLPEFPGLHAAERQWRACRAVAGATVHYVDQGVDSGEIILQGSLDVRGDEGEDGLQKRILHEVEHVIYPRAVRMFLERLHHAVHTDPQSPVVGV